MKAIFRVLPVSLSAALLAACGGNSLATQPSVMHGGLQQIASTSIPGQRPVSSLSPQVLGTGPNLYVSNFGNSTVTVYGLARGKLLSTISRGVDKPDALAFAPDGRLWVANTQPERHDRHFLQGSVSIYNPGGSTLVAVLRRMWYPQAILFDSGGYAYIANRYVYEGFGTISEYAADTHAFIRDIGNNTNLNYPDGLAIDPEGNLYVSNWAGGYTQSAQDSISVFNSIGTFEYSITQGVFYPRTIAYFSNNLYVANGPVKGVRRLQNGSISVYSLGATSPSLTITSGIHTPVAMAFDGTDNLYVANLNGRSVTVYARGEAEPIRTISDGVRFPRALAMSPTGDLFVANLYQDTITAYPPSSTKPRLIISAGLDHPNAIVIQRH